MQGALVLHLRLRQRTDTLNPPLPSDCGRPPAAPIPTTTTGTIPIPVPTTTTTLLIHHRRPTPRLPARIITTTLSRRPSISDPACTRLAAAHTWHNNSRRARPLLAGPWLPRCHRPRGLQHLRHQRRRWLVQAIITIRVPRHCTHPRATTLPRRRRIAIDTRAITVVAAVAALPSPRGASTIQLQTRRLTSVASQTRGRPQPPSTNHAKLTPTPNNPISHPRHITTATATHRQNHQFIALAALYLTHTQTHIGGR